MGQEVNVWYHDGYDAVATYNNQVVIETSPSGKTNPYLPTQYCIHKASVSMIVLET